MIAPKQSPPKKELTIIEPKIKPDAPNTKPGDVGNGRVLVVDERTQRFNGIDYHLNQSGAYYRTSKKDGPQTLHIQVWEYHNGTRPKGYLVHHEHRDAEGKFDRSENNIEWLRLMPRGDHTAYHSQQKVIVKRICAQCGQEFETANHSQKYCSEACTNRRDADKRWITRICPVCKNHFKVRYGDPKPACSDECEAVLKKANVPIAYERCLDLPPINQDLQDGVMIKRVCPICNRAFSASRRKIKITCSFECGVILMRITRAKRRAMEEQMKWNGPFFKLINKTLGASIRTQMIDGEPWFVAKDVCDALDIKKARNAVARLDDDEKRIVNVADNTLISTYGNKNVAANTVISKDGNKNVAANTVGSTDGNKNVAANTALSKGGNKNAGKRGNPNINMVNEFGLYRLILESRKKEALEFKRWITHKVLPALRKYGSYIMDEEIELSSISDEERQFFMGYYSLSASDRQLVDFIIDRNNA